MVKTLIVGTGRCRTGWAHKVLSSAGMPITHQSIRHEHLLANNPARILSMGSDVSFEAVPVAELLRRNGWKVFLLVRDPAMVVRSWLSLGAFADTMHITHGDWWKIMTLAAPEIVRADLSPIERATRFYIRWNYLALMADPVILNVETLTSNELGRRVFLGNRAYSDPGVVDVGTPGRIPVELDRNTAWDIRDRVSEFLPHPFHYHPDVDDSPRHPHEVLHP